MSGKDKPPQETRGSGSSGSDGNGDDSGSNSSSSGLSTKAKIAVGVAVPVGALLLIGLVVTLVMLARRHRKNRATAAAAAPQHGREPLYHKQMNEADGTGVASPRHELADEKPEPHMLDSGPGVTPAAELAAVKDTSNEPSELQDLRAEQQALEQQLARIRERQRAQKGGQPPVELP